MGSPSLVSSLMVSLDKIAPPILLFNPGVVTISSRYFRRISTVWGIPTVAKRVLQVGLLSSMARIPFPLEKISRIVSFKFCLFISASSLSEIVQLFIIPYFSMNDCDDQRKLSE